MAKGQRAAGPMVVWMIVFVALWLTSTVFLVILYTGQEEINKLNTRLKAANARLITPSQDRSLAQAQLAQAGGPTVVGLLEQARGDTAFVATGHEDDGVAVIRAKRDQVTDAIAQDGMVSSADAFQDLSLHESLNLLYESYKAQHGLLKSTQTRVEEQDAEVARLVQLNADQQNDFDTKAKELSDQLEAAEASRVAYRTERDASIATLESDFTASRDQCDADLTAARQRVTSLERAMADLQQRYAAREERLGDVLVGPDVLATARQEDGKILMAIPGDEVVYINLGSDDGLTLGLQFSVYSADDGIPADGRAKARIEVASISESSAECKIVQTARTQIVLEGDLVANPIYDRDRRLTFLAIGGFDLNRDGQIDPDGLSTVKAMISQWGGVLTEELDARTDFVVLGGPPRRPRPLADVPAERRERHQAVQAEWDRYTALVDTAKRLSIPVMPQDVFLNFLGFSLRTP